jgi:hypothetical protein
MKENFDIWSSHSSQETKIVTFIARIYIPPSQTAASYISNYQIKNKRRNIKKCVIFITSFTNLQMSE